MWGRLKTSMSVELHDNYSVIIKCYNISVNIVMQG